MTSLQRENRPKTIETAPEDPPRSTANSTALTAIDPALTDDVGESRAPLGKTMLDGLGLALTHANRGYFVFPVTAEKVPHYGFKDWNSQATRDRETIKRWWKKWPGSYVAIALGRSGLTVIDFDVRAEGNGFDSARAINAPLNSKIKRVTMSGEGEHHFFFGTNKNTTDVNGLKWVDSRSAGGYVVAVYMLPPVDQITERIPAAYRDAPSSLKLDNEDVDVDVAAWRAQLPEGPPSQHVQKAMDAIPIPFVGYDLCFTVTGSFAHLGREGHTGVNIGIDYAYEQWNAAPHGEGAVAAQKVFDRNLQKNVRDFGYTAPETRPGLVLKQPDPVAKALAGTQDAAPTETAPIEAPMFIDLTTLDNVEPVVATLGLRVDGVGLLYSGAVNGFLGDPEQGKSIVVAACAIQAARNGATVVWLDLDHNGARAFRSRIMSLAGADGEELLPQFLFSQADDSDAVLAVTKHVVKLCADAAEGEEIFYAVDSVGELLPMFGASTDSSDDYTRVHRAVLTAAARAGACVSLIDHLAKGTSSRAYGGAGTIAKKRAIDGALYKVEATQSFVPGRGGVARLKLMKDRHGSVRAALEPGVEPIAAMFTLNGDDHFPKDKAREWAFHDAAPARDTDAEGLAQVAMMDPPPASQRDIRAALSCGAEKAKRIWDRWQES